MQLALGISSNKAGFKPKELKVKERIHKASEKRCYVAGAIQHVWYTHTYTYTWILSNPSNFQVIPKKKELPAAAAGSS